MRVCLPCDFNPSSSISCVRFCLCNTHVLDQAIDAEILGQKVRVSSAEGLIVMKLIAMRPQDESDIRDLITAYGHSLNFDFIRSELDTVIPSDDVRRQRFESWVSRNK